MSPPEGGREVAQLTSLRLAGWKSIRDAKIELRPLNVLIGANGTGKSNLVSFFKLMNEMMGGRFQEHVGTTGGAESLLHYGSKRTPVIEADFRFLTDQVQNGYFFRLVPTVGNSLLFSQEQVLSSKGTNDTVGFYFSDAGHRESKLTQAAEVRDPVGKILGDLLSRCQVF